MQKVLGLDKHIFEKLSPDERKMLKKMQNTDAAMGEKLMKAQRTYYKDKSPVKYGKLTKYEKNDFKTTQELLNYRKFLMEKHDTPHKKIANKYLQRSSPPYPANEYCGRIKRGNDGKMYISTPNKNKACSWKLQKCIEINEKKVVCIY